MAHFPDPSDSDVSEFDDLLMVTVEPGQMSATLKALADAGLTRGSGHVTGSHCTVSGGALTCTDAQQDPI